MREYKQVRAYKNVMGDLFYTEDELEEMYTEGGQAVATVEDVPAARTMGVEEASEENNPCPHFLTG